MKDEDKTKAQLINELVGMRQRVAELRALGIDPERAEETLRKRIDQGIRKQGALLELARMDDSGLESSLKRITEVDSQALSVERVSCWFFSEDRSEIVCEDLFKLSENTHEKGLRLKAKQYPSYFQALEECRIIAADDAHADPRTREFTEGYLDLFGITSMMDVPAWFRGKIVAIVCHEHVGPRREWTLEEQDFASSIADMVSLALAASERRQVEEALHASKAFVETIFDSINDSISVVDVQSFKIVTVNKAFLKRINRKEKEVIGKPCYEVNHNRSSPCPPDNCTLVEALRLGRGSSTEHVHHEMDGTERYVEVSTSPIKDHEGKTNQIVHIARDISERKWAGEALERQAQELARSNAELEQFAYIASHDLQEPLRMVSSYVQLLARRYRGELDSDAHEFIDYAVDGATRMQALVNALLAYSRVGTRGKDFELTDCASILDQVLTNLQPAITESGAVITHDPLPIIMADELQLAQLFQNLVSNAVKFHGDEPPRVHVWAKQEADEWVFSVRDNGIGIDPEHAEGIFVVFRRLHGRGEYPGTGIGLAICEKIVRRHGGRIWVESEPGKGSVFYFTMPKRRGEQG